MSALTFFAFRASAKSFAAPGVPLALPHLLLLIGGIALAAAPHIQRLPVWIAALATAILLWRAWAAWNGEHLPRRWLLLPLTILIIGGVYFTHRTLFGRDAGVTLLVVLLALKLLELRSTRDVVVTAVLAYFLALAAFFYSQRPLIALTTLCTIVLLTAALVAINAPHRPLRAHFKTAGMLLAQSIPLMVILFFLFPRIQGPLWGMPADAFAGKTGLSDSMSPGNISSLSQSDEIAFRVVFDGAAPPRQTLYWRGPVFWDYDGRTWRAGNIRLSPLYQYTRFGEPTKYAVTLEPHNRTWLFALDIPTSYPSSFSTTADYQLRSREPVRTRMRYEATSHTTFLATGGASPDELRAALARPAEFNPRATALARSWRDAASNDAEVVKQAIAHFSDGNYRYTLYPPLATSDDTVDEFLFETRRGFCEHYASAFVVLMRAAGVPARVVTGYQGGEINPVDGYMTVRQSDAHAWAEVWLGKPGWVRIDPTAAAVPIRTLQGLAAAVPAGEAPQALIRLDAAWMRTLRFNFEALSNHWNQWVLGYDMERQRTLFTRFGMPTPDWHNIALALFWTLGVAVLLLSLWLLRRITHADPAQVAWLAFCKKLRKRGIARRASEGPIEYASRAAIAHPQQAQPIVTIARLYAELRYGPQTDSRRLAQLARLVQRFRP